MIDPDTTATDYLEHVPNIRFGCSVGNANYESILTEHLSEDKIIKLTETKLDDSDSSDEEHVRPNTKTTPKKGYVHKPLLKRPCHGEVGANYNKKYGIMQPCPFKLMYRRMDPWDENSNFILDSINPLHNHEL